MWTIWGVTGKLATRYTDTPTLMIAQGVGNLLVALAVAFWTRFQFKGELPGIGLALAAGLMGTLGTLFFYFALSKGRASVIVPMTALYPLLVAVIGITFLGEPFTWKVGLGTGFALLAMLLFSL
jgi:transporter family protein